MPEVVVIISANAEWREVRAGIDPAATWCSPFGEAFEAQIGGMPVVLMHGGWGKVSAAASAQYALQRWQPRLLVNLGTCGGIAGEVIPGEIILVEETLIYDICERMGDPQEAIAFYTTSLDLAWVAEPLPLPVRRARLLSADHDLDPAEIPFLREHYRALAVDWESGAIAWVAARNGCDCLILRGVSDIVDERGGQAYHDPGVFQQGTRDVMVRLLASLPGWLAMWRSNRGCPVRPAPGNIKEHPCG
jgi:adenosylhomocysteine nucleosidase